MQDNKLCSSSMSANSPERILQKCWFDTWCGRVPADVLVPSGLDARLSYKTCGELPGAGAGWTLRRPLDAKLFALPPFHTRDSPLGKGRTDAGGCESEPVPSVSYQPISGALPLPSSPWLLNCNRQAHCSGGICR